MAANKATIFLVVGALSSGGAAAYFADTHISSEIRAKKASLDELYKPVQIVVPTKNLRPGDMLHSNNVAIREVPGAFVHAETITPANVDLALNHRIVHPLNDGEPLLLFHVSEATGSGFSTMIEEGKRALTFPVDIVSSVSGLLRPGDRIDLLVTLRDGKQQITQPLLRNVQILAAGNVVDQLDNVRGSSFQTITLSVSPLDAAKITHARNIAKLTVVLRTGKGAEKTEEGYGKAVTLNTLLGRPESSPKKVAKKARTVQIIRGGAS